MGNACGSKIAVVDDETTLREAVVYALRKEGFSVSGYDDGRTAWPVFQSELPDLVILDIMMPVIDGLELLRRIRTVSREVPVIFLTSREEEFDRVLGLELGADDYLTKPFSMRELAARVRVHLRRLSMLRDRAVSLPDSIVHAGNLALDTAGYTASWNQRAISFTVTEFRILEILCRSPGVVKTRDQLLSAAYPEDIYLSDRTIDTHIKRIRAKIGVHEPDFSSIETVHGLGYRFVPHTAGKFDDRQEREGAP